MMNFFKKAWTTFILFFRHHPTAIEFKRRFMIGVAICSFLTMPIFIFSLITLFNGDGDLDKDAAYTILILYFIDLFICCLSIRSVFLDDDKSLSSVMKNA